MICLDNLPDSLELENIDGKIFTTREKLNIWIGNFWGGASYITNEYATELNDVLERKGFIVIDNDEFYYYLDSHPDYPKIKSQMDKSKCKCGNYRDYNDNGDWECFKCGEIEFIWD